jgi:hypothetical protein
VGPKTFAKRLTCCALPYITLLQSAPQSASNQKSRTVNFAAA